MMDRSVNRDRSYPMVNAPFLLEVKESQSSLMDHLRLLHSHCSLGFSDPNCLFTSERSIGLTLQELRDSMATAFELEETYGYVKHSKFFWAELHQLSARALAEHQRLYLELVEFSERVDDLDYRGWLEQEKKGILKEFQRFLERIFEHEKLEMELIRLASSAVLAD